MARIDDNELKTLKWLLDRLQVSEDWCRPYFDRAKRHYRLYRFGSAVDDDKWPYVNRARSRDILAFIEDSTSLLVQTLFASMPFFSVIPRETRVLYTMYEGIDPMAIGDQIARCLDYQISHEETEFFPEIVDYFKAGTIYGNSYIGIYPKFDNDGSYRLPLIKNTDFWDLLPIVGARRVTKARGVFIREFVDIEELQRLQGQGIYKNVKQLTGRDSVGSDPDKDWHKSLLEEIGMTDYRPDDTDIEVIHYISGGHIITLANRKTVIRNSNEQAQEMTTQASEAGQMVDPRMLQPFPYNMPIVQYKYMPVPMEFYGMGIPEVLEVLQEDKNLIRSARRDNIDLVIQKIIKARSGADINFDLIKHYPGAIWPMENLSDLEPWETTDVTASSYNEEAMREHDMENALSLFGYARGMTPQHSEQPTTVMKLQQASLNRLDLSIKLAEFGVLQNIATRIILLTRRFMKQETYEAIVGDQDAGFYRITEEDIRRFYHFKPIGSSVTNIKEIRQTQIQAALQLVGAIPPEIMMANVEPFTVNYYEAYKTALDALDIKNADRILIKLQQNPMAQMGGGMGMPGMEQGMGQPQDMEQLAQIFYGRK